MSQHIVEVIEVKKEPHPNADSLSIVRVAGFVVCVRSSDWRDGALAAYIEPDMVVPDTVDFAWLCQHVRPEGSYACARCRRIKARRLRGVWSMGLLVPAPAGAVVGQNVMDSMGITRYEPPEPNYGPGASLGAAVPHAAPLGIDHVYDVENYYRYPDVLQEGERVVITEKIHGANARFTWREGQMWVGSRKRWLAPGDNVWYKVLADTPGIEELCKAHPGATLYGEVYGTQDLRYSLPPGKVAFVAFDLQRNDGTWYDYHELIEKCRWFNVPMAPVLYVGEFDMRFVLDRLVDGVTTLGDSAQVREGIVIKATPERWDPTLGRVILKVVSNAYLERVK